MSSLKIPLEVIESLTNNFDDANFIGEGFLGKIYEGQLSLPEESIDVAIRRLDRSFCLQEMLFEKEISILSGLEHPNMVSIVGFCYENDEMLIVSKRVARGSLRWHLSDSRLTWMRRLHISIGVVSALSYLHSFGIIHHNINSDSILLDEYWEAKISGFEYSMTIPARHDLELAYEKLGIGTYRSDVFSIGMVLFELLCGREAFVSKDNNSFQASLAIFNYRNGKLHELVDPGLYSQMDQLSFKIFTETAYKCLTDERSPPTMNEVLRKLERALKVQQMHENNEHSTVERTLPEHLKLKMKSLEHMRIPLADIEVATANFSKGIVSSGGYGSVYTAELDHVHKEYCLAFERKNDHEIPKKRSIVAIKRIIDTEDEIAEQGFYAEIEMLTSCKHSNIIPLLGFCDEGRKLILIYEYASNRSLSDYLLKKTNNVNDTWARRVKICLDVAKGLSCLHTTEGNRQEIVHRDIKSANILLDEKFEAKVGDFGLSVFLSASKDTSYSRTIAGTPGYMDPQYCKDAKLKRESDVYSFGVVLFEILFGTVAYDTKYNNSGLAIVATQHFDKGTIEELVDPKIKEEITETFFNKVKGANRQSLDTFSKIAYKCLAKAQVERPTMKDVIKELEMALFFQETRKDILQISLKDIKLATNDFSDENYIQEEEGFFKAYRGKVSRADGNSISFDVRQLFKGEGYASELNVLTKHKHENIIGLLGYCEEGGERIIVYEHMLNGSLDNHMNDGRLTWEKRLKICIDIASSLNFLHGGLVTGEVVIHRNIRSMNILLDSDMKAKIANFGFSILHPVDQETVHLDNVSGTPGYMDPEYERTGVLSKESDIYSFGIVLFEVLLQRLAYSEDFQKDDQYNLGPLIKELYKEGKLENVMFEGSANEHIAPQSVTIFKRIAIQCLRDKKKERPTAHQVLIQLKQALEIQEKGIDIVRFSFEDIKFGTHNFSDVKCIGSGAYGTVYKGQLPHAKEHKIVVVKRFNRKPEFFREQESLLKFRHMNVINLEGYCDEMDEKILVYEYASNGSLDKWLKDTSLTWMKRLEICIDIASALEFLHGGVIRQEAVIHRDIKSSNILLSSDWKAKISDFKFALISPNNQEINNFMEETVAATESYIDPAYMKMGIVSKASDIYSFGVVLFETLCGRLACSSKDNHNNQQYLGHLAKSYYEQRKLDELVFEGIKEQIVSESLSTFATIAYKCLNDDRLQRPTAGEVVAQLKEAKEFQVDYEMWEPKLPSDYKELIQQSRMPKIYDTKKKKDIYEMLCEGILIQKDKVWFWLDGNNKRNEMISATLFTYKNQSSLMSKLNRTSRFHRVVFVMDISNLKIQAKIKAQFLTPNVVYGIYLVFKFVEPHKISSEPKYVNLKYKMGDETLCAYFATSRKDKWMMVELYRFLNDPTEDDDFEVLLESFSRCYCGNGPIYVEGIEFRAIDNVTHEEIEKSKDVIQILRSNSSHMQPFPADNDEVIKFSKNSDEASKVERDEIDKFKDAQKQMTRQSSIYQESYYYSYDNDDSSKKPHMMISAKKFMGDSSLKSFISKPSEQCRFGEVIEVPSQQVFRLHVQIHITFLSPDTDYSCYLIFKLSEKCGGLHSPVKVRCVHRPEKVKDQLHQSKKETKTVYFRTPKAWNIHDINQVPKQREDGWMEVNLWKFNSKNQLRNDWIMVNLKVISYEGTMNGLIVCGLELRPL